MSSLGDTLISTEGKEKADESCKAVLAKKIVLANIITRCMTEFENIDAKTVAQKYIEGEPVISGIPVNRNDILGMNTEDTTVAEGKVAFDIIFKAIVPNTKEQIQLIINIEAQNKYNESKLLKRAAYYCARLLSRQKDTEFSGDDYGKIKKVVSIWLCFDAKESLKNTVSRFSMNKENLFGDPIFKKNNYDVIEIILVCLGDENKERNQLLKYVETMFSETLSREEKRQILENEYSMVYDDVEEVLEMCNYSDYVWEKGLKKGKTEGEKRGRIEATLNDLVNIMETFSVSLEKAFEALKIPQSDREMYKEKLEARNLAMA